MDTLEAVLVPDIGDFKDVKIIELLVRIGDVVQVDDPLIALETDKATMEVPSPRTGIVRELKVEVGGSVSQGSTILVLEPHPTQTAPAAAPAIPDPATAKGRSETKPVASTPVAAPILMRVSPAAAVPAAQQPASGRQTSEHQGSEHQALEHQASGHQTPGHEASAHPTSAHATPSVRKLARELGVDLAAVTATGAKNRITKEDVQGFIKLALRTPPAPVPTARQSGLAFDLPAWPVVDFARYGPVERQALSRIKTLSGANLARNWLTIPHVTNFDEADVTDLEEFRKTINKDHEASGTKVTMLTFLIKAMVATLRRFPTFNASLDGDSLVLKNYFHVGFAADTPRGLLVPVLRDADRKGLLAIAAESAALAKEAREGKLKSEAMQGGCISISSLGGIGGTGFTPIINAPEVAILGVAKAAIKPVWDGAQFRPRLIMPISLSWDHRVVDGAEAGRFLVHLASNLGDFRRLLL